eukprot:gene7175-8554_t
MCLQKVPLLDELVCLAPHTEYGGPGLKGMDYREVGARDNWELFEKSNARKWLSSKQTLRKLEALFNRENGCGWIGRLKMPNGAKSSSAEHEEPIQPVGLTVECITNFILEAHKRHRNPNATPHTHLSSAPLSEPSRSDEGQSRPVNIWNDSEAPDLLPCRQKAEREGCSFNVVVIKRYKLKSRISAQAHK